MGSPGLCRFRRECPHGFVQVEVCPLYAGHFAPALTCEEEQLEHWSEGMAHFIPRAPQLRQVGIINDVIASATLLAYRIGHALHTRSYNKSAGLAQTRALQTLANDYFESAR